jgi:hypothetical protein
VFEVWLSRLCESWTVLDIPLASPNKSVVIVNIGTFNNGNRIEDEQMSGDVFRDDRG